MITSITTGATGLTGEVPSQLSLPEMVYQKNDILGEMDYPWA
jgi:hypothetical protein